MSAAAINAEFLMSTEEECLSSTPDAPEQVGVALGELLRTMATLAPTLAGPTGIFNGYGRAYIDAGHAEFAIAESHSPYVLALLVERQRRVAAAARQRLAARGRHLVLANNNHSGLLQRGCPVWGSHENYLVEQHPSTFTELILPFLVTRLYAGAGGVEFPSGNFLAGVRATCMEQVSGGNTTGCRAIHSTCREEHHMGASPSRFRYHGILGDGHRSQFNLALQFGATALALKAIVFDHQLPDELARIGAFADGDWLGALQRFNVLQPAAGALQIDPTVVQVQRVYLDAAHRYVDRLAEIPVWVPQLLQDWDATLSACAHMDRAWLSARLDAFAKYEFYSAVLAAEGTSWRDLPRCPQRFPELALLDHSYHNFGETQSVFTMLEQDGLLQHRVGPCIPPGEEPDPFVPETHTRAAARARFIRDHDRHDQYVIDWSCVYDRNSRLMARLEQPFATAYGEWTPIPTVRPTDASASPLRHVQDVLRAAVERIPF